ncbi:MAG: hypothetical protein V1688_04970 [bacterium]
MNDEEIKIRFTDIYRESVNNYWGVLLTANTILISVFFAISIFSEHKIIPIIFVVLSIISSFLLIINFRIVKDMYEMIGKISLRDIISEEEVEKNKTEAFKKHNEIKKREKKIEYILIIEAVLILLIMIFYALLGSITNCHTKQIFPKVKSYRQDSKSFHDNKINKFYQLHNYKK